MADHKLRILSAALEMSSEANKNTLPARKVSNGVVAEIVNRSMSKTEDMPFSVREHAALSDVSDFISMSHRGRSQSRFALNTDLLPVAHPLSTRPHRMSEFALREARARWMADDPAIKTAEARALVASLHSCPFGSAERDYYETRVLALAHGTVPLRALVAALGGNSSAARSMRARLQRRDRKGRFAWMGGGMSALIRMRDGSVRSYTGRTVAQGGKNSSGSTDTFDVEMSDGRIARFPASAGESHKAYLESKDSPDGFSPKEAKVEAGDPIIGIDDIEYVDAPAGFNKVDGYDGPGEALYTDEAFNVVKYDKDDSDAPDPTFKDIDFDKPVYAVTPWDDDSKEPYAFQSWDEVQDFIRGAEVARDEREGRTPPVLARLDESQLDEVVDKIKEGEDPEDVAKRLFGGGDGGPEPVASDEFPDAPKGAYVPDTSSKYVPEGRDPSIQESTDYTDDPAEIAGRDYTNADLIQALKTAVMPTEDGRDAPEYGKLEFDKGDEDVPAEALYEAIQNRGLDAKGILEGIYQGEDRETPAEGEEPVAELPETAPEAPSGLPELLEGLSDDEKAKYEETGDYKPFLPKNDTAEAPDGYTDISPEPFTPGEGDPAEFDPINLAKRDSEDLYEALRTALEPGNGGMGPILTEDKDGEITRVDVPGEAIRDALQLRGADTNDFINSVYDEGRTEDITDAEATDIVEEIDSGSEDVSPDADLRASLDDGLKKIEDKASKADWKFDAAGDMIRTSKGLVSEDIMAGVRLRVADEQGKDTVYEIYGALTEEDFIRTNNRDEFLDKLVEIQKRKDSGKKAELPAEPVAETPTSPFIPKYYSVKPDGSLDRSMEYTDEYGEYLFSTDVNDLTLNELSDLENIISQVPDKVRESLGDLEKSVKDALAARSEDGGGPDIESGFDGDRFSGKAPGNKIYSVAHGLGVRSKDLFNYLKKRYGLLTKSLGGKIPDDIMAKFDKDRGDLRDEALSDAMRDWLEKNEDSVVTTPEEPVGLPSVDPDNPAGVYIGTPDTLRPGDITFKDDPEREYFVVESVEKKGGKVVVTGHYPGHESQQKEWRASTPITFIRGSKDVPEAGDKPALERPFAKDYGPVTKDDELGWVPKDSEARAKYLADKKAFEDAKAESGESFTPPIDVDSVDPVPLSAPSRPSDPVFAGERLKALIAEADGDPKKLAELLKKETVYYIDFETTGQSWDSPTPIQVAVYKYTNGELDGEPFVRFMNPGEDLGEWYETTRAEDPSKLLKDSDGNPITNEFLATQADKDEVLRELYDYLGEDPIVVAHNMAFDGTILDQQAQRLDIPFTAGGRIDTLTMARTVNPKMRNDLSSVAKRYGVSDKDWHDAAADADVLPTIMYGLLNDMKPWHAEKTFDMDARTAEHDEKVKKYESDLEAYRKYAIERAAAEAVSDGLDGKPVDTEKVIEDATVEIDAPKSEDLGPTTEGKPGMDKPVTSVVGDKITTDWVLDDENTEDLGNIKPFAFQVGDFFGGPHGWSEITDITPDPDSDKHLIVTLKSLDSDFEKSYRFNLTKRDFHIRRRPGASPSEEPTRAETPEAATPAAPEAPRGAFDEISTAGWEPFNPVDDKGVRITKGSTPGVFLRNPETGVEYYVKKPRSEDHARNEVLASALYEKAGILGGRAYLGRNEDGDLVIVSPLITGGSKDFGDRRKDEAILDSAREGFAIDAWLNNWDVVGAGFDNMLIKDGRVYRIDAGGSLLYRARGGDKRRAFTPEVSSIDSMRDSSRNPSAAAVFDGMSDEQIADSVSRLLNVSDADIEDLTSAAYPDNPEEADFLATRLKERRADLMERFGVSEGGEAPTPAAEEAPAAPEAPEAPERTGTDTLDTSISTTAGDGDSGDVESALEKALDDPDLADSRDEIEALLGKIKEAKKRARTKPKPKTEEEKKSEDISAEESDAATDVAVAEEVGDTPEEISDLEAEIAKDITDLEEDTEAPETPDSILRKLFDEFSARNNGDGTYTVWEGTDAKDGKNIEIVVQKNKDNTFSVVWRVLDEDGNVERAVDSYRSRHSYKALKNLINRNIANAVGRYDESGYKKFLDALARRDKGGTGVGSTATESIKMTHPSADGISEVSAGDRVYNWKTGEWGTIIKRVETHRGEGKTATGEEYKYTDYVLFKADGKKARRTPSSYMFVADPATGEIKDTGVPVPEVGPKKKRFRPERPKAADPVAPLPGDADLSGKEDLPSAQEGKGLPAKVRKEIDSVVADRAESFRDLEPLDSTKMTRDELVLAIRERVAAAKSTGAPMSVDIPLGMKDYDLAEIIRTQYAEFGLTTKERDIWLDSVRDKVRGRKTSAREIRSKSTEQKSAMVEAVEWARANGRVAIATPVDAAIKILKGGRWKTQFESGSSRGSYSPTYRATHETTSLDLHPGVDPRFRPVYGHLRIEEDRLSSRFGASGYGDIVWEMKPEIKERATLTLSDSLGDPTRHLPMTGDVTEDQIVGLGRAGRGIDDPSMTPRDRVKSIINAPYVEVQVMGGVTLDDVEKVWMTRPRTAERKRLYQDLINAGISVEFYEGER